MRRVPPFAAAALLLAGLPIALDAQQASDGGGAWSSAGEGETRSLALGQPSFVWIERLRRADAPIIGFASVDATGRNWPFESGLLEPGSYSFQPNGRFDAASAWRVVARAVTDGAGAGATRETALQLQPNQPVRLPPRETPAWIAVDLPGAGVADLELLAGSPPPTVQWTTAAGKVAGTGPHMPVFGPRRVFLQFPPSAGEIAMVRFERNRDTLEPNDQAPMAAPSVPGRWYRVASSEGDTDWLEIKLAADALVSVSTRGLPPGEAPALLGPDGSPVAKAPLPLKAGTHRIAVARGSITTSEPYMMRVDALPHQPAIRFGEPMTLAASALPSTYELSLKTAGARRIDAWPSGAPRDADIRWTLRAGDRELAGGYRHAIYVPAGSYTMNVEVPASADPRPFRFTVTETEVQSEPNDTREQAAALALPATLAAEFGLPADQDWYRLSIGERGILRIRQPDDAIGGAADIAVALHRKGEDAGASGSSNAADRLDMTFSVERGDYDLRLSRARATSVPVPLELSVTAAGAVADTTQSGLGIAMVGFGVRPGDGNWMETLARDKSLEFISADEEGDFGERLTRSLDAKIRALGPDYTGWIIAGIVLALLAAAGVYVGRRRGWTWRRA